MPQEDKAQEPSVTFKVKAGLPSDPQEMEVHAAEGDLKPWDLESLPGFQHMGKPYPRFDGPLKVTGRAKYTYDIKLPGMLYGRMVGATIPAGTIRSRRRKPQPPSSSACHAPLASACHAPLASVCPHPLGLGVTTPP